MRKFDKKATRLFSTGAWPQGTWGMAGMGIAPTMVNLQLSQERYPDVQFHKTREH